MLSYNEIIIVFYLCSRIKRWCSLLDLVSNVEREQLNVFNPTFLLFVLWKMLFIWKKNLKISHLSLPNVTHECNLLENLSNGIILLANSQIQVEDFVGSLAEFSSDFGRNFNMVTHGTFLAFKDFKISDSAELLRNESNQIRKNSQKRRALWLKNRINYVSGSRFWT